MPNIGWQFLIFALLFMLTTLYELIIEHKIILSLLEIGVSSLLIFLFHIDYVFLLPIVLLDFISYMKWPIYMYFIPLLFTIMLPNNQELYLLFSSLTSIIYYQNYIILFEYQSTIKLQEQKEYLLKSRMKQDAKNSQHHYEKQLLLERESLFQRLHDRLGHTINGSIYQLEASKLLVESTPIKSRELMENVIRAMRSSMDDIRQMLHKERPNKQQLAMLQLQQLCNECKNTYDIDAILDIETKDAKIPERLWEVILDNSVEAVTNALKYSKCKNIEIKVRALPQFIQCWIKDDGIGCEQIQAGMGIQGMKQRVRKVNGTVHINSEIGFEIQMILPFNIRED
ncbi:MAG: sensor histidine kinase [Coprobacillaceae bacterium]